MNGHREQLRKTRGEQVKSKTEAPFGLLLVKGKRNKVGKSGIPQNKIKLKKIKLFLYSLPTKANL